MCILGLPDQGILYLQTTPQGDKLGAVVKKTIQPAKRGVNVIFKETSVRGMSH